MELLHQAFVDQSYVLDLEAHDFETIVHGVLEQVAERDLLPRESLPDVESALLARERVVSTAIGHAVAVPHAYREGIERPLIVFVRLLHPLNLGAPDGIPTRFLFVLLGPPGATVEHLDTLTNIARVMSDDRFRYEAGAARSQADLIAALQGFLERTRPAEVPAAPELADGLAYTGRLGGGLWNDLRRRVPHYASDFLDGLHSKTVSSTLFLFFACLAPAITFGGLMGEATGGAIGAVEMITASAVCGVIYALVSGQPLIILGGTGPLLVLTTIVYAMCDRYATSAGIEDVTTFFLATYAWIGLWTAVVLVLLAVVESGCLMRYFTRFTDETFSALISVIFVYEAVKALIHEFDVAVVTSDGKPYHATALLSLLLALGTFYIAINLSRFRRSRYLQTWMREFLADFGPTIALVLMTVAAIWFGHVSEAWLDHVELRPLDAPAAFATTAGRPWLVDLNATPGWIRLAALIPALFVAVLVYLDQNITARIVNSPDHKLFKGEAYHWDLGLVGLLVGGCSLFGLPWLVAATVRSLNHVRSLATVEEVVSPQGETREQIIHTRETRMTALAIHVLLGVSLVALPLLQYIPMAVLYGLFLFMGVVSMSGNQFFERLNLWPMDPDLYPSTHYVRLVPNRVIHAFTLLQLSCLAVLWLVKVSPLGILFPVFIALLVPIRMFSGRFFDPRHLAVLDADEEPEDEMTHWVA